MRRPRSGDSAERRQSRMKTILQSAARGNGGFLPKAATGRGGASAGRRILLLPVKMAALCRVAATTLLASLATSAFAATWGDFLNNARADLAATAAADRPLRAEQVWAQARVNFPVECDWLLQDAGTAVPQWLASGDANMDARLDAVVKSSDGALRGTNLIELYVAACEARRERRLQTVFRHAPKVVFTKRRTVRPSFFAYTEAQSDAQHERFFIPGAELCLLEWDGTRARTRTLLTDANGVIRDPAVSWDGARVVFAWKKSLNEDDYHLYEISVASGKLRQITSGTGVADYEPAFLPNGDLVFASTRCVQTVDCWWTEVSNLYTCDADGRFLRRLGFDQVHTVYPQVLEDGRVIYSRWDYNDRGQVFPQALFQMNADGTAQAELYGNNSWFPTTIAHARGIPGTQKVLAIFCGHHTSQAGKLGVLDPAKGRQENSGAQLVAPVRATPAERIDAYGQQGELFQYPFPLTTNEFLVGYAPDGWERAGKFAHDARFGIYWMDMDGHRELLVSDAALPCNQPVPLVARTRPLTRPSGVDYAKTNGTFYVQDIHAGDGLAGVPRGTIKKLRVVALEFRAAGVGENRSMGPAGAALASTPVSIGNGTWDVKVVLGDAPVFEDGSAFFKVPARTPVYFQALDAKGQAVQTMRSWSTLQPGEAQSCVGCHDNKNTAPTVRYATTMALRAGAGELEPFHGAPRGFSFAKEIQPILDRHCVRCHDDRAAAVKISPVLSATIAATPSGATNADRSFSLLSAETIDPRAKRRWSDAYLVLTHAHSGGAPILAGTWQGNPTNALVNWIGSQSVPSALPPYFAGAARSGLMPLLEGGHKGVKLSREELEKFACWIDLLVPFCGDYTEAAAWTDAEKQKYERYAAKRRRLDEQDAENVRQFMRASGTARKEAGR